MMNLHPSLRAPFRPFIKRFGYSGVPATVNGIVLGQSIAGDIFDFASAKALLISKLKEYTGAHNVNLVDSTTGGTYASHYSTPGDATKEWVDANNEESTCLTTAFTAGDASGLRFDFILNDIGISAGAGRVEADKDGFEDISAWTGAATVVNNGDGSYTVSVTASADFRSSSQDAFSIYIEKTESAESVPGSFPAFRDSIEGYFVFDRFDGTEYVSNAAFTLTDYSATHWRLDYPSGTSTKYIYPARHTGVGFNSGLTGSVTVQDANPSYTYASFSQEKAAQKAILDLTRARYGKIPCFIQCVGGRDGEVYVSSPYPATQLVRQAQKELIAENDYIHAAGEYFHLPNELEGDGNPHLTEASQQALVAATARAIAAQVYGTRTPYLGATVTAISSDTNSMTITTTPERNAAWALTYDGNGEANVLQGAGEVALFRVFEIDSVGDIVADIAPTAAVHCDETHATTPNSLVLTFSAGALTGKDLRFAYGYAALMDTEAPSTILLGDKDNAITDENALVLRATQWSSATTTWSKDF